MELTIVLMCAALVVHVGVSIPVTGLMSPANIFLGMQLVMAIGTADLLDLAVQSDKTHWFVINITYFAFLAISVLVMLVSSSMLGTRRHEIGPEQPRLVFTPPSTAIQVAMAISILVCLLYYNAVGYNVLLSGLFGSGIEDVASARLAAYAGEDYFFPGYVNQFRNALLPALVIVVVGYAFARKRPGRWLLSGLLVTVTITFLMGTGQRGSLVTMLIVTLVFATFVSRRFFSRMALVVGVGGVGLFSLGSIVLGRSSAEYENAQGAFEKTGVLLQELLARIVDSNQLASVTAFRYIDSIPLAHGQEMFQSMVGLLPGVSGSNLSNVVFSHLYGSDRGTAPPSIWGVVFHDFGEIGVVLAPIVLAIIYAAVGIRTHNVRKPNSLQAVGLAGVTTVMGMWVAGGPEYLANSGILVFMFLWWWGSHTGADEELPTPVTSEHIG